MKCHKCGSDNRIGAKFCSECGAAIPEAVTAVQTSQKAIDERLSNALVELWKLYESNELDAALEKIENVKRDLPESTSVYSLAALVYEKKAKIALDSDNKAAYCDNLSFAAQQYEAVLKQNPNSAADKAKLEMIKKTLNPSAPDPLAVVKQKLAFLKKVSLPVRIAVLVFVLVITASFALLGNGGRNRNNAVSVTPAQINAPYQAQQYQTQVYSPQQSPQAGMKVYSFPLQKPNTQQPESANTAQAPAGNDTERYANTGYERQSEIIPPIKLPSLVKIVPTQNRNKAQTESRKTNTPNMAVTANNNYNNASNSYNQIQDSRNSDEDDDADTWLARAISLDKSGQPKYAAAAAEKAIKIFRRDLADGRNPEDSENGLKIAEGLVKKLENQD